MEEGLQGAMKDSGVSLGNLEEKLKEMNVTASDVYLKMMNDPALAEV